MCILVLQEGGPLPGPETGLLTNTREWIVWGNTRAEKASDFIGKGRLGGEQEGKGTQENSSAPWLVVSGFMVMGLVSGVCLAHPSDSEPFLVVHVLFSQDGRWREGFWEVVGHVVSPFDLSRTLRVGGGLFVPCSFPGPSVIKQLMQMVTVLPGQGGRFQSLRFPQGWAYCDTRCSQRNAVFLHLESYIIKGVFLNFKNIKFENIQNRKKLLPWYLLAKTKKKFTTLFPFLCFF